MVGREGGMTTLNEELIGQRKALESYWETKSSVGIVLLDPVLNILDCNQGFIKMFHLQKKPIGSLVGDFLKLGIHDLKQSGEFKVSANDRSGVDGILYCHIIVSDSRLILFCERLMMTESRAMEQFGVINSELIAMQRESIKKNRLLEKLRRDLDERVAELEATLLRVKQLEGTIPICTYCKKIRDDQNSWQQLEKYISEHSEALFSHGACPDCCEEQMKIIRNMKY
jgi:hypothetical protein